MNLQTGKVCITKKALCVILSIIMAFGTFITFTVGYSPLHEWMGIRNMLSAYAAEFVDTDGAVAVDEDAMLADDHTINLENKDGSNTVYLFSEPISYTDDNGNIKTKDISVEKAGYELKKEGYDFTNGQNDYRINFSKDYNKGIQAEFEGASYSIIPQSIIKVDGEEAVAEYLDENFEVFQYKNIYGNGTNLRFYPQLNGVKDEIILNQNINKNTFSFELKTENCTAQLNEDSTISLVNKEGITIQTFAAPFAYDSEYVEGDNTNHYVDCEYTLEDKNETSYIMTITVPNEWLNNANTKYPVTIDPTTSNISQAKDAGTYKKYKTQNWGSEQLCCFGYSSDYDKGRVYTQFTLPAAIKKGATINSAYQWERETTGRTTSTKVIGYMVKASWSETGITWENKPGYNSSYASNKRTINSSSTDNSSPYWYKFSIKSIVNQWINGGSANYGITFRSDEEDNLNYNWRAFAAKNHSTSSYRPYTVINYTNEATPPTIKEIKKSPTGWTNQNVTFTVIAEDKGSGLAEKAYGFSDDGKNYTWQASNQKTYSKNQTVYFRVRDVVGNHADTTRGTYIDKLKPGKATLTLSNTNWTNQNVTVTASASDAAADSNNGCSGINGFYYSTNQTYGTLEGSTKTYSSYAKIRACAEDKATNKSASWSDEKTVKIDKVKPIVSLADVSTDANTGKSTIHIQASDALSGIKAYSLDGGNTWINVTDNDPGIKNLDTITPETELNVDSLDVRVKDLAGNVSDGTIRQLSKPAFYDYNGLVGIYNPNQNSEAIKYKVGDDGSWKTYTAPIAIPYNANTKIYAKFDSSDNALYNNFNQNKDYIGEYTESSTDFVLDNNSVSFAFERKYSSLDNKWTYSTDSHITIDNDYIIHAVMPGFSNLTFVKQNEGSYLDEINGYTLTKNADNSCTITVENITYYYGSDGKLNQVTDAYGNTIEIIHNTNSIIVKVSEDKKYTIKLKSNGDIDEITDPVGNNIVYTYGGNHLITEVVDQSGVTTAHYSYTDGLMDSSLFKTINYYDNTDRLKSITKATGEAVNYSYPNNNTVVTTSSDDKTTTSVYNDAFLLTSYTDEDGNNTSYTYDTYYQVTKEETSESTVDYIYNGRLLVSKSSDNEEYLYNNGRLIRQKIDNVYTFFEYNNEGDITFEVRWEMPENYASTVPNQYSDSLTDAEIKRYNYNNNGTQNYFIDSKEDKKTSYNYSNNGKTIVIAVYKASDSTILEKPTKNVYNVFGNLLTTSIIDEDNNEKIIVANTYDEAGKVLLSNNDGAYTRTFYDSLGRVTRQIEPIDYDSDKDHLPENKTYDDVNIGHKYYYAENGNLSKEINRLGVETEYEYYENSSTVKKETFDIYEFTYNKDGKILKSTVDGNTYAKYNYNNEGNPVSIIYNNGQSIYYNYDKDTGNLVSQHRISLENDPYVEYSYERILVTDDDEPSIDTASQLDTEPETEVTPNEHYVIKSKINYDSKLRYAYQDNGWVKVYNTDNSALVYSYLVTESDNAITTTGKNFGVSYSAKSEENGITYDYNGNKLSKTVSKDDNGTTVTISNAAGTILSYTETESDETASRTYNLNGNTLNVSENYNLNGKITSATEDNRTTNYEYYSDGQLQSVSSNDYSASYQYSKKTGTDTNDIRGNIISKTIGTNSYTYTYDTNIKDRLTSYNGNALTYDNIGNVLTYGNKSYTWSSGRSLQSIVDGNKTYSYTYNKYGYRTSKTTTTTMDIDGETTQESVTTYFNVDDNGTIISQKTNNDVMYFEYDNSGVPLGFVYNETQYLYLTNISGDVIGVADNQGNILARYSYDEWGKVTVNATGDENIALANLNPLRYRGYYYDNETDYYYLQSRYYDPEICRFINADLPEYAKVQKNLAIGINSFVYCGNDAINNSDYFGYSINLSKEFSLIGIVSAVLSCIEMITLVAFQNTPWGKLVSAAISLASVGSNVYAYAKANKKAKNAYGKKSSTYKRILKFNNVVLGCNIAIIIISYFLGKAIVRKYSVTIALALMKVRTITIVGLSINIVELLSGKDIMYRSKKWW